LKRTYISALLIGLATLAWLFSGQLGDDTRPPLASLAEQKEQRKAAQEDVRTKVRGRIIQAVPRPAVLKLRGRTKANRTVNVRAEVAGRVINLPRDRGAAVEAGDPICELDIEDHQLRLAESMDEITQAQMEYQGARELLRDSLQSRIEVARAKFRLTAAETKARRNQITLQNTRIRAPFDGVIETRPVEIGTFMQPGSICAQVIDLEPLLLSAEIAERDVQKLTVGQPAQATLITGETVSGTVTFLSREAHEITRTYEIEIELPNPGGRLRSGITADIYLTTGINKSHLVSAALLGLDDAGRIGLRTVDSTGQVQFHIVRIVAEEPGAIWVTGLPEVTTLITVGQELVVPGQFVEVFHDDTDISRMDGQQQPLSGDSSTAVPTTDPVPSGLPEATGSAATTGKP